MKFYVYHLVDPRNGSVFYVGKGQKSRMNDHAKEALRGVYSRKCNVIRSILAEGMSVTCNVVQRFADEADAYDFERLEIERIGLASLTNVMPGGGGFVPKRPTEWNIRMLKEIAPGMARSLSDMMARGSLFMGDVNVTGKVLDLARCVVSEVGDDEFSRHVRLA